MTTEFPLALALLLMFGMTSTPSAGAPPAASASSGHAASTSVRVKNALLADVNWSALSSHQRTALAPLEREWPGIDAPRKAKWLEVAARFPSMPAADQHRVQERMAEWARMSPAERGRARLSFQASKQFSPEQKQASWEAYKALPEVERRALASRSKPAVTSAITAATHTAVAVAAPTTASAATPVKSSAGLTKPGASALAARPLTSTVVQAKPGATTTLMTTRTEPASAVAAGRPKIVADPIQVNRSTLLPQNRPQAAASAPRLP